ncbi:/ / hypothetical protein / 447652:448200 Reverse [Candidatus Hepatoplasma crinochetorum]|uniref:Uncharacterized protein n=1 Tax=Candidatus Hepatoplasma crinochetorum TaxID=295596 RepID=A0A0G7ZLC1_9MOLU|nr:/ / hypothetical protein / 447652:448200 Reverse [Candidatus Hepatoplasma crinochetorum]
MDNNTETKFNSEEINNVEPKMTAKEEQQLKWKNSNKRLWPILIFWIWFLIMGIALGILAIVYAVQAIQDTFSADDGLDGFIVFLQSLWVFIEAIFYVIIITYSSYKIYKFSAIISENNYQKHRLFVVNNIIKDTNHQYSKKEIKKIYKQNKKERTAQKEKEKQAKKQLKAQKKLAKATKKANKKKW